MTNAEKKCRELWRRCVKYRDRWCVICGRTPAEVLQLEAHHIYFLSNGNWKVQFDTDFGVSLCFGCHHEKDYAPHVSNEKFLEKVLTRIKPERAAKIIKFLNGPKKPCTDKPYYAEIAGRLQVELIDHEENYWMNRDVEPFARGASI